MKEYKVVWSGAAGDSLRKIHRFIARQSPRGAGKVVRSLVLLGKSLETFPARYSIDPNFLDTPHVFRSVSKWNYKIVYRVDDELAEVIIAQVFDTRRDPGDLSL